MFELISKFEGLSGAEMLPLAGCRYKNSLAIAVNQADPLFD